VINKDIAPIWSDPCTALQNSVILCRAEKT